MSQAASQAAAFYRDVAKVKKVWSIRDANGIPAPIGSDGKRAMPFWSSLKRVNKIILEVPDYSNFELFEIEWEKYRDHWLSGLEKDGLKVGVNWSGKKAVGYDVEPSIVKQAIEFQISEIT